jgi:hypothetical protein
MLTWRERDMGSAADYEAAQTRARALWNPLQWPESIRQHAAVSRVDGRGGYAILETDDLEALHMLIVTFPAYEFEVVPVVAFDVSIERRLEALAWREENSS